MYQTAPSVFGVEGKTYTLKVVVEFNGVTDEYEATSLLPYAVRVDSVAFRPSPVSSNLTDVLLYGQLPESRNSYLNIQAYRNDNIPVIIQVHSITKEYADYVLNVQKELMEPLFP